jgi:SAM-dependent methyltransferase
MLDEAKRLDQGNEVNVVYKRVPAEDTRFPNASFDLITAGQCWHWFDRPKTAREVFRLLAAGGMVIISHFDWIPLPGNVVAETEALIIHYNPLWKGAGGNGFYPDWLTDLGAAGFRKLETFSFDNSVEYSHESWRGRIRASAGIGAALTPELISRFDQDLADLLRNRFPCDPMQVPHRVFAVLGQKPI